VLLVRGQSKRRLSREIFYVRRRPACGLLDSIKF
jgi:hypothetical protein